MYLALCKEIGNKGHTIYRFKNHYEGWDLITVDLGEGQISYHIPTMDYDLLKINFKDIDHEIWDGHSSNDVIKRLKGFLCNEKIEQRIEGTNDGN